VARWLRPPAAAPSRPGSEPASCMVVVAPLQKYSNRADESATATKPVRVRFLSAIEVQGGPYLKGYVKGTSLPLIESFIKCYIKVLQNLRCRGLLLVPKTCLQNSFFQEPNFLGLHLVLDLQGFVQLQVNLKAIQPGSDPVQ